MSKSFTDLFHEHLDKCQQCENQPHNLCPTGALLLKATALDPLPFPVPPRQPFRGPR